tara:strand:- start:1079 stop:1342 length:264 start_codon:yes stop_codon:yes gene_type:complete
MKTMVEMEGITEKQAIINLQVELIDNGDYMTQLIDIQEVNDDDDGGWSLEDGTPLDQDSQDALKEAFDTFVNEDGLTMKEVIDNKHK